MKANAQTVRLERGWKEADPSNFEADQPKPSPHAGHKGC